MLEEKHGAGGRGGSMSKENIMSKDKSPGFKFWLSKHRYLLCYHQSNNYNNKYNNKITSI